MNAPFPWFGGKSRAADLIWSRLGNVPNYVEPFAGSLAALLGRPHAPNIETVNDLDGFVANFWRAVKHDPQAVAAHADNPVNECDLHARHLWLVDRLDELPLRLMADPDYYDSKIAGWWCWGLCTWIGSGWCSGEGPWQNVEGVFAKGKGVRRQLPHISTVGNGVNGPSVVIADVFAALSERMRRVRVCCGDWSRVTRPSVTGISSLTCGVVLDPPYDHDMRDKRLYRVDDSSISSAVCAWALENGDNPKMRIALCGYEGEHDMPTSWECVAWKAQGGYGGQGDQGNPNSRRERVWFSPHCLKAQQGTLF